MTDSELLNLLQSDVEECGPLLLHDGNAACGLNRGLAWSPHLGRDLRGAIAAMAPIKESPCADALAACRAVVDANDHGMRAEEGRRAVELCRTVIADEDRNQRSERRG